MNNNNFVALQDIKNLSETEALKIYEDARTAFESSHNNFCDASDAEVLTVFPFDREAWPNNIPDDYDVKNLLVGLLDGMPALKDTETGEIYISGEKRYYNIGFLISFDVAGLNESEIDEYLHNCLNAYIDVKNKGISNLKTWDSYISRDKQSEEIDKQENK